MTPVRAGEGQATEARVVVGYDGSDSARRAVARGVRAAGPRGQVILVAVEPKMHEDGIVAEPLVEPGDQPSQLLAEAHAIAARTCATDATDTDPPTHHPPTSHVHGAREGNPADEILEAARAADADLIVSGVPARAFSLARSSALWPSRRRGRRRDVLVVAYELLGTTGRTQAPHCSWGSAAGWVHRAPARSAACAPLNPSRPVARRSSTSPATVRASPRGQEGCSSCSVRRDDQQRAGRAVQQAVRNTALRNGTETLAARESRALFGDARGVGARLVVKGGDTGGDHLVRQREPRNNRVTGDPAGGSGVISAGSSRHEPSMSSSLARACTYRMGTARHEPVRAHPRQRLSGQCPTDPHPTRR